MFPIINNPINPYRTNIQGRTNEPICVAALLDNAKRQLKSSDIMADWTLEEIYNRLNKNAPRIAIIGGSIDHPGHLVDIETVSVAALRIWKNGGVPFHFSTPVMCDGTAQSNQGMSYSLESRNVTTQAIINQMESHSYHGAFVIQSCDKQPFAVVNALSHLDYIRQRRGEAPVFATFVPAQVLKGGEIPTEVRKSLENLVEKAKSVGEHEIANDLKDTLAYILQCSTNTSYQGIFERAIQKNLITETEKAEFEKSLCTNACDKKGGVCAFNGTGNTCRHIISGLGLVHPSVELLVDPVTEEQINVVVDGLAKLINRPEFSVRNIVGNNIKNGIRIHSSTGGSTNVILHLVASMLYAGFEFDLWEYKKIHKEVAIPDLFDYSLTQGRDIFALATHCCSGKIRGMETLFYELIRNGVEIDLHAPTITGQTWAERLKKTDNLPASGVKDNPVILSKPRRSFSGVDVLKGNFFESAVVKISGMPNNLINEFDKKVSYVLYFENEEEANQSLLDPLVLDDLKQKQCFSFESLQQMCKYNAPDLYEQCKDFDYNHLYDFMVESAVLKITIVISGQGPTAYGMPEMFTPMQHINANAKLKKLVTLISDGRYSGVTRGAAIGHMTPEALNKGGILYLETGDLLYIHLRNFEIQFIDKNQFINGNLVFDFESIPQNRKNLGELRLQEIKERQLRISAANRMIYYTDASQGVIPKAVAEDAKDDYHKLFK